MRAITLAAVAVLLAAVPRVAASEAQVMEQLARLRGVRPVTDRAARAALTARIDGAWKALAARKAEALPVLRRELSTALTRPAADPFFVLDAAHLLYTLGGKAEERLALSALAKIDPAAPVIRANYHELFDFAHLLARGGSPAVLPQLDRIFLLGEAGLELGTPPRSVKFDAAELCVFLYGATGPGAEAYLLAKMDGHPAFRPRGLDVLASLGSAAAVPRVKALLDVGGDFESVGRAVKFLMTLGGPAGRDAVLQAAPERLDDRARAYLREIRADVKGVSPATLLEAVRQHDNPAGRKFTDAELRPRLDRMETGDGLDPEGNPSVVATSRLPRAALLEQLKRIRARTLHRFERDALDDVEILNLVINTLQFPP